MVEESPNSRFVFRQINDLQRDEVSDQTPISARPTKILFSDYVVDRWNKLNYIIIVKEC